MSTGVAKKYDMAPSLGGLVVCPIRMRAGRGITSWNAGESSIDSLSGAERADDSEVPDGVSGCVVVKRQVAGGGWCSSQLQYEVDNSGDLPSHAVLGAARCPCGAIVKSGACSWRGLGSLADSLAASSVLHRGGLSRVKTAADKMVIYGR